ncbi:MAG: glycogen/starch/alpha-glucan phosphorylase, partial [Proteobacteria bacterium]|nr:glycogen/starch/alpha-glucan phosphorylase [Pseudomonadota bacterium]
SLFDIQVKRIHEYKRQHLNVLHVITLYNRIRQGLMQDMPPRTVIFGGKEASGTGNMKFSLNGALTIGTLDGANVEIREEVGADNFFFFGLTAEEVKQKKRDGYRPEEAIASNDGLSEAMELLESGFFSNGDRELFRPLTRTIREHDEYMLCADYPSYVRAQEEVGRAYLRREEWLRMSVLSVARIGKFSSDRAIREYCEKIWQVSPVVID